MKFDFQTIARAAEAAYAHYQKNKAPVSGPGVDPRDSPHYWYAIAGYSQAVKDEPMPSKELTLCCICGKPYEGMGHNPDPVGTDGRCCDACNNGIVVPIRMLRLVRQKAVAISKPEEKS